LLLALVFGLSAAGKITAGLGTFNTVVYNYHLLPYALVKPFAYTLPWIEALVALYLLVGLFLPTTAVVTGALLVMFTGALGIEISRGNTSFNCGCLPTTGPLASLPGVAWLTGGNTIGTFDVVRDLIFIALAVVIFFGDHRALSLDGWRARGQSTDDALDEGRAPLTPSGGLPTRHEEASGQAPLTPSRSSPTSNGKAPLTPSGSLPARNQKQSGKAPLTPARASRRGTRNSVG
jgi:hypothetical protein